MPTVTQDHEAEVNRVIAFANYSSKLETDRRPVSVVVFTVTTLRFIVKN